MTDYTKQFNLTGKVALVTGAARGLGAEMAEALVQCGAKVLLTDVLDSAGQATAERLGASASFFHHDVTDEAQWQAAIAAAGARFGGLDVLVNNAGIEESCFLADLELADFKRMQAINVDGTFLGIKHAIRTMRPGGPSGRGGSIINLSSVAGLVGTPGLGSYCASKGGVRLLSKAAGIECARLGYGIRVNSIHPAIVKTDMGVKVIQSFVDLGMSPDLAAAEALASSLHPMGFGQPTDIASAVLFLASDASRWMTGSELVVDGGASAT